MTSSTAEPVAGRERPRGRPEPGWTIAGKYVLGRLLGEGGMGAVYEATQVDMGRRVALKIVRPDLAGDGAVAARFRREARAVSRIESPYVVVVHDFGEDTELQQLYLVMELLDGSSLEGRLADGPVTPREAVRIAVEVAEALAAAHAAGVVHRDLKPDNVFIRRGGSVKVVDFGIARILDSAEDAGRSTAASQLTQAGSIVGTPLYMSPEAVARRAVGPPADLYALGCILFRMLVGRPPFEDPDAVPLMGMHLRVPAELLREAAPSVPIPDALEVLVDELLAKAPDDRPPSAAVVAERLRALDWDTARVGPAEPTVTAVPAPSAAPAPAAEPVEPMVVAEVERAAGSRRTVAVAAGALALVAVVAVVAVGAYALRARPEPVIAVASSVSPDARALSASAPGHAGALTPELPAVEAPPAARAAPDVEIVIDVVPPDARVTWDGVAVVGSSVRTPQGTTAHVLSASADGYVTGSLEVVASDDRRVALELEPSTRARRAPSTASTAGSAEPEPSSSAHPVAEPAGAAEGSRAAGHLRGW